MTDAPLLLVVEAVPDLAAARTTRTALFAGIAQLAGVKCVYEFTDLSGLSTAQLRDMVREQMRSAAR